MEVVITKSPHAIDPSQELEPPKVTKVNEIFRPYTAIDVITKVYHRSFSADLSSVFTQHPECVEKMLTDIGDMHISRCWVNDCKVIRPESIFDQPLSDVKIDILVSVKCAVELVSSGCQFTAHKLKFKQDLRLRYSFDLRPCHLECFFEAAVLDERYSLLYMNPHAIRMNKYFLPVLTDKEQYDRIAGEMLKKIHRKPGSNKPLKPSELIKAYGLTEKLGEFDDDKVVGEFFFNVGEADVVDEETGEVKPEKLKPGTILINWIYAAILAKFFAAELHELSHYRLALYYLMLQKTHGHEYCSYLCKKQKKDDRIYDKWSPVDIMELQANRLPGFLLIPEDSGKKYAGKLLKSYGGERTPANMRKLVDDMAEHYITTKTTAKTRLLDFGFAEVAGVKEYLDDKPIPAYISKLNRLETYTISEADGIREYVNNENFRAILQTGEFVYVEGHYCLNEYKYVRTNRYGVRYLTPEARNHMDECCLVFKKQHFHQTVLYQNGVLCKGSTRGSNHIVYRKQDGSSVMTPEGKALRRMMEKQANAMREYRMPFNEMTVSLMEKNRFTIPLLTEKSGVSEDIIKAMRNDPKRAFAYRDVISISIAMHLLPKISEEFVNRCPCVRYGTPEENMYEYARENWYMLSIEEVNRKIVECGFNPLNNLVDGFDEDGVLMEA